MRHASRTMPTRIRVKNWGQVLQSNILRRGAGLSDGLSFGSPLSSLVPSMSLI